MTNHDSHDDSTDSKLSRRGFIAAGGTMLTAGLAGCQSDSSSPSKPSGPSPDITLQDVRVVQTVENSELTNASTALPDPPIVADEYATVMFDVSISNADNLPEIVKLLVTSTPDTLEMPVTASIHRDDLKSINDGADAPAVFHARTGKNGYGEAPPVFEMDENIDELTVEIAPVNSDIDGDTVTLTEGSSADFEVETVDTLRVGFIPIQHRGATSSGLSIDWGDSNGGVTYYQRSVASSFEVLQRAFPGQVVAYRHDTPLVARDRHTTNNAATRDAEDALQCLNQVINRSGFPSGGEIITEDVSRSDAIAMMDGTQGGALDGHALIVPKDSTSANGGYFPPHWSSNPPSGYHYHFNAAVAVNEAGTANDDVTHAGITAQELGHRFAQPVYSGAFKRNSNDGLHADGNLESTCYDLTDGTYALVNDWSVSSGTFTNGGTGAGTPTVDSHVSYMSYANGDHWADSRIHRYLIEGDWTTGYGGGGAAAAAAAKDPQRVIAVFGRPREGELVFDDAATYVGIPRPNAYDPDRDHDANPVGVRLEDPAGEVLVSQTVPDRFHGHHGAVEAVSATLPFPTRGVRLVGSRGNTESELNPIVAPLRNEVREMPARALVEGEYTRDRLLESLAGVDAMMGDRQYREAGMLLQEEFVPLVDRGVTEYENFANEFTAEQLVDLTNRMAERLVTVAE